MVLSLNRFAILSLILLTGKISESFYIAKQGYNRTSQMNKCIAKIIENLPGTVRKISFLTSDSYESQLTMDILGDVRVPVLIDANENPNLTGAFLRIYNSLVIIETDNLNVTWVLNNVLWNSETKFLVVSDVSKINFGDFWKESVANAYYLCESVGGFSLYGFVPYNAKACEDVRPILLDEWRGNAFVKGGYSKLYERYKIKDAHQCIVNLSVLNMKPTVFFTDGCIHNCSSFTKADGTEARLMKVVAEKFNFNARFAMPADGQKFGSLSPPKGILGEVLTGRSRYGFGSVTPVMERFEKLDFTRFYQAKTCVTYTVPVGIGKNQVSWLKNVKSDLRPLEWILILASLMCVLVLFFISSKFTFVRSFLYVFEILLGHSVKVPKRGSLRFLLIFWIIFSIWVTNIYQASLGSQITVPIRPPEINTMMELAESKLLIMGYKSMYSISTRIEPIPGLREVNNRFIVTDMHADEAIDRMANQRDMAIGGHMSTFLYAVLENPKARGRIRPLKQCAYDYYATIILHKHSPFTTKTNHIIGRLFDSGIGLHWKSLFFRPQPRKTDSFSPLTLEGSLGVATVLMLGLSVSSAVFVAEIFTNFVRNKVLPKKFNLRKKIIKKKPVNGLSLV